MSTRKALRLGRLVQIGAGAGVVFVLGQFAWGSERFYDALVMPTVHRLFDPETAHRLALKMAAYKLTPRYGANHKEYVSLRCEFLDMPLKNPIGIAAGFDKSGEAIAGLKQSGVGFVEIGTVTPLPQSGNEKPRVFRLDEDRAIINRYGFNNDGVGAVSARVKDQHKIGAGRVPLGVNLGKNRDSADAAPDYEVGVNYFATTSDFVVINVSSPNTPGLRALQTRAELEKILTTVHNGIRRQVPEGLHRAKVLLKISPDLSTAERKEIAKVVTNKRYGVDGLIVSNTTTERSPSLKSASKDEIGGLSGSPLRAASTQCIADMYRLTNGKVPIVGCGGIENGADAYEKIRAGASVVQLYSSLVFHGWPIIGRIKRELNDQLRRDGYTTIVAAIGADQPLIFAAADDRGAAAQSAWWRFW